jgi:hypothetical protein
MATLDLGGIRLSDRNGSILNGDFLTPPDGAGSRTASFRGDERLFVGVLPAVDSASTQTILLEVQNGEVSYSTTPGLISIRGTFYATQPNDLARGERFIYQGSLTLPIRNITEEEVANGYRIESVSSASEGFSDSESFRQLRSEPIYFEPSRGLTFISGGTENAPSLRVAGELISEDGIISAFLEAITSANYTVVFSEDGRTEESNPKINVGRTFTIPLFAGFELEAARTDLIFGTFNSRFGIRLGGDFRLKNSTNKQAFGGRLNIVSPDNFLQFGGGEVFRVRGTFELRNLPLPPLFVIQRATARGDTQNFSTIELSAQIGLAFSPADLALALLGEGSSGGRPRQGLGATVGLIDGRLDTLIVDVRGLKIPLGSTPFLLTGLGGGVRGLANENTATRVVLRTFLETTSRVFVREADVKGEVAGEFSIEAVGINGRLEFFAALEQAFLGIRGFATAEGNLVMDWSRGTLTGRASFDILANLMTGRVAFAADSNLNFGFIGELAVNVPRTIPILGGRNLGRVGAGFQFINDNNFSNDFAAAWLAVNLGFFRTQIGFRAVFDGTVSTMGASVVAQTTGILDGTIGAIASGDLARAISNTTNPSNPFQSQSFLIARFDRSEFNFSGVSDFFLPIALSTNTNLTSLQQGFNVRPGVWNSSVGGFRLEGTAGVPYLVNGRTYRIPQRSFFLNATPSDLVTEVASFAEIIPELSNSETVTYAVDLDKFRQVTGGSFAGFAKVAPTGPVTIRGLFEDTPQRREELRAGGTRSAVFSLQAELVALTDAPDVTLNELRARNSQLPLARQAAVASSQELPVNSGAIPEATLAASSASSILTVSQGEEVEINYEAFDPDSEATISFYYDTNGIEANGMLVATGIKERDGANTYVWNTKDVPTGTYYVYAVIDDGESVPIKSYLPDPVRILDPEALPQVQGVAGRWLGSNTIKLDWEPIADLGLGYYVVSYTRIASGDGNEEEQTGRFEITEESSLSLTGLQPGDYYRFKVKAINEDGQEGLTSEPVSVLVGDRYTARLEAGEWEFKAYAGSMYIADLSLNQDQQAVLLQGPPGSVIEQGQFVWEVPVDADFGMYEVVIKVLDTFGNESFLDRRLMVSSREIAGSLLRTGDTVFTLQGTSAKLEVKTVSSTFSEFVNELGVFTVDDEQGRIDGLQIGDAGYLAAAVNRAKSVFSVLAENPPAFNESLSQRLLSFEDDTHLRFLLVKDGSLDGVRDGQVSLSSVLLPTVDTKTVTREGNGQFQLQWEDGTGDFSDFDDLVVQIQATDRSLALGGDRQFQTWEMFDFTDIVVSDAKILADITIYQSLDYDNVLGFYEVVNTEGAIVDSLTGQVVQPWEARYGTTVVRERLASFDTVINGETDAQGMIRVQSEFSAGKQFAPFVIVNGRPEQLLDDIVDNDPQVYFPYMGSNTDRFDRFRLLGDNIFAFEDAGDRDFNDIVIKSEFQIA